MSKIGKIIKKHREKKSISINKLAQELGVSASTVRDWEQGRNIQGEPYRRIAEILEIGVSELLGCEKSELIERVNHIEKLSIQIDIELKKIRSLL